MKRLFLVMAAFLMVGRGMATSLVAPVVEYEQLPATGKIGPAQQLRSLSVYYNGRAVASVRTAQGSKVVSVQRLDTHQMDQIIELAKDAREGKVVKVYSKIACFAMSPILHKYTIDYGRKILYQGHPCNGPLLVNDSPAAPKLRNIVNGLLKKAFPTPTLED